MPTPSWDLAITVIFLVGIAFGYILQRDKIIATLLSVYVALIVTQAISGNLYQFFQGDKTIFNQIWIRSSTNPFTIRVLVFLGIIMLLSAKSGISGGKSKGLLSPLEVLIYSTLTTGLIISSVFYFMPPESREAFTASSRLVRFVINNYIWWIILPVVVMVAAGYMNKSSSSSD